MVNHAPEVTARFATRLLFFDSGQIQIDSPPQEGFEQLVAQGREHYLPGSPPVGHEHLAGSQP
jgi:hypothetical protein